jgi:hypothetical protein
MIKILLESIMAITIGNTRKSIFGAMSYDSRSVHGIETGKKKLLNIIRMKLINCKRATVLVKCAAVVANLAEVLDELHSFEFAESAVKCLAAKLVAYFSLRRRLESSV